MSKQSRASIPAGVMMLALAATCVTASAATPTASARGTTVRAPATAPSPAVAASAPDDHFAAMTESIAHSRQNLRVYHWTETAVVNNNGRNEAPMVARCSFDPSGRMMRAPVALAASSGGSAVARHAPAGGASAPANEAQNEIALIRSYVPLDPVKIEHEKHAGKMTMSVVEPGKEVRYVFKDYEKAGDDVALTVNPANNRLTGLKVESYLASPKDAITLNVDVASLPDGTQYPAKIHLDEPSKQLSVTVTNSDYHRKTS